MLRLRIVQADFGDAFIVAYGESAHPSYLLIDGGPDGVYQNALRAELQRVAAETGQLALAILSHVDTDHIIGMLDLFAELTAAVQAGETPLLQLGGLWLNSFEQTIDRGSGMSGRVQALANVDALLAPNAVPGLLGIGEGNQLRRQALQLHVPLNAQFPDGLVSVDAAPDPIAIGNLSIRVVGPTQASLDALRTDWEQWLADHEDAFATRDLKLMRNADKTVPNLSSIMLHVSAHEKTILFTGDGRSDHLLQGLGAAGLLDDQGQAHVDVLKVAHHGSDRNATKAFFRKVTADTYVISANGNPDNPDLATLIWIVEAAAEAERSIRIMATNATPALAQLAREYPASEYGYTLDVMAENRTSWDLDLA